MPLSMGSYLCVLRMPGFPDVRYPVHITRNRAWRATMKLRTQREIGDGFVHVPGGPFVYGEGKAPRRPAGPAANGHLPTIFSGHKARHIVAYESAQVAHEIHETCCGGRGAVSCMNTLPSEAIA